MKTAPHLCSVRCCGTIPSRGQANRAEALRNSTSAAVWLVLALLMLAAGVGRSLHAAEAELGTSFSIDGTWRWSFTMPDGSTCEPKLLLETEDGSLSGTTSFRPGSEMAITNVVLHGNRLQFQVVRERGDQEIITSYSGVWSGKVIRGTIESNWAGEPQSYDWLATRTHEGAEGLWKWTATYRGRKFEARVKLVQDGETLTGSVPGSGRGPRRIHIKNGSAKGGEVYFEIERGTGENRVLSVYKGKQSGDTIKGAIETIAGGKKAEAPWEARRPD